jgi:hypothetical protein
MIDANHLLKEVIRPVLQSLGMGGVVAEAMVLGTACQESKCGTWLVQLGNGPAKGIYQCEPATHEDLWTHFLSNRPELAKKVNRWRISWGNGIGSDELTGNLYYATAICRIHYYRSPEIIPDTLPGQAAFWKKVYNTPLGAGTVQDYVESWRQFAPPMFV